MNQLTHIVIFSSTHRQRSGRLAGRCGGEVFEVLCGQEGVGGTSCVRFAHVAVWGQGLLLTLLVVELGMTIAIARRLRRRLHVVHTGLLRVNHARADPDGTRVVKLFDVASWCAQ